MSALIRPGSFSRKNGLGHFSEAIYAVLFDESEYYFLVAVWLPCPAPVCIFDKI